MEIRYSPFFCGYKNTNFKFSFENKPLYACGQM